jgi:hypothetical protein
MPSPPSQPPSLEGSEDSDTGNSTGTGTTTDNRAILQADGTFASTPCALHTGGEIQ